MLPVFPQEIQKVNRADPYYNKVLLHVQPIENSEIYFNGSTSYSYPSLINILGTNDFTIETRIWVDSTGSTYGHIISFPSQTSGVTFKYSNTSNYAYYIYNGPTTSSLCIADNNSVKPNRWQHVVYQRRNGVFYIYVDGVLSGVNSSYTGTSIGANGDPLIGNGHTGEYLKGYLKDFKFTYGIAKYIGSRIELPYFSNRGGNI